MDFWLVIPSQAEADVSSVSGDVYAEKIGGDLEVSTVSGNVEIDRLRTRFYSMLETYKLAEEEKIRKEREGLFSRLKNLWPRKPVFQFALTLGMLVLGLVIGNVWTVIPQQETVNTALADEVQTMRQTLAASLIDQGSASERLQGINMSYTLVDRSGPSL